MRKPRPDLPNEYLLCVGDLLSHPLVCSMEGFVQHNEISCLEHSISVSFTSYRICRRLGLDSRAAARGGLLHDFFLYDWHTSKPAHGLHGYIHPRIALDNANKNFLLSAREQDIIRHHMWPVTIRPPKFRESYIVLLVDKYYAVVEYCTLRQKGPVHMFRNWLRIPERPSPNIA
jgi:uncharacterized protein